jgi:hypothetical protein
MTDAAADQERLELAQALMAEITARLEDLSADAASRQRARSSDGRVVRRLRGILVLAEAYAELIGPRRGSSK